jgi:hypothetical protein
VVAAAGFGVGGEVDAEAVGGAEAGAFADEHDDQVGAQALADFVAEGDSGLGGQYDRGDSPVGQAGQYREQHRRGVVVHRARG